MSGVKKEKTNKEIAFRVSKITIMVNLVLSVMKLIAGVIGHSKAMISDAVHSASDVFSTFIVMLGVGLANKASDDQHQYGHERLECVASILLAVLLSLTGLGIGYSGLKNILSGSYGNLKIPGWIALAAAIISIVVKEWMYHYTKRAARKIHSGALMADAWHHRSDALSSIGAFIGIFGARLGYPVLDSAASIVICLFIEKAAYDIFTDAMDKMVDHACKDETVEKMREVVEAQDGVVRIDEIRTRLFGDKSYVDIEIAADGNLSLYESHAIAEQVHHAIEKDFADVKHCMVHVNPA